MKPVTTQSDVVALADLRYDEWIAAPSDEDVIRNDKADQPPPPSRYAFRMATAEIAAERSEGGGASFLAFDDNDGSPAAVGAAELSPIEFDGAILKTDTENTAPHMLYVTDVVTSSRHRRMGIANALMDVLEQYAINNYGSGTVLFLHVKPENEAAQNFYSNSKRGYSVPKSEQLGGIHLDRLEENSGTAGQILLCKTLDCTTKSPQRKQDVAVVGTGFGAAKGKSRASLKKSKRKKK